MVSIKTLAKELDVSVTTIRNMMRNDENFKNLFIKVNHQYRVKTDDVVEYFKNK